ncbi:hypothetical protein NFI96_007618, partial [Prochilodus magdalenae]
SCEVTLDPNTAYRRLPLSDGNRKVERVLWNQPYPDHPERFDVYQVLSRESLTGRCYWEAEWSGEVYISVSYKSISRKGGVYSVRLWSGDEGDGDDGDDDDDGYVHDGVSVPAGMVVVCLLGWCRCVCWDGGGVPAGMVSMCLLGWCRCVCWDGVGVSAGMVSVCRLGWCWCVCWDGVGVSAGMLSVCLLV